MLDTKEIIQTAHRKKSFFYERRYVKTVKLCSLIILSFFVGITEDWNELPNEIAKANDLHF